MKRVVPFFVVAALAAAGGYFYAQAGRPAVLGSWEKVPTVVQSSTMGDPAPGPKSFIFLSDGTVSMDGRAVRYRVVDGTNIVVTYDKDTQEVFPFRLDGDQLTLWIASEDVHYRRHDARDPGLAMR